MEIYVSGRDRKGVRKRKGEKRVSCEMQSIYKRGFCSPLSQLSEQHQHWYYSLFLDMLAFKRSLFYSEWKRWGTKLSLRLSKIDFKTNTRFCVYIPSLSLAAVCTKMTELICLTQTLLVRLLTSDKLNWNVFLQRKMCFKRVFRKHIYTLIT